MMYRIREAEGQPVGGKSASQVGEKCRTFGGMEEGKMTAEKPRQSPQRHSTASLSCAFCNVSHPS